MPYEHVLRQLYKAANGGQAGFTLFVLHYGPQLTARQLNQAATTWEKIKEGK